MLGYIDYLGVPMSVGTVIVGLIVISQIIVELLTLKGKVVPEIISIRKLLKKRKEEKEIIKNLPSMFNEMKVTLNEFNSHYSNDNITKRDNWIKNVDDTFREHEAWACNHEDWAKEIVNRLDRVISDVLDIRIEDMRSAIIDFAAYVIDENNPVTREQFNRIFKIHSDYEKIITNNGKTNGEVDIAFHIITEAYEAHLKNHTFIEDIRGYTV